MTYEEYKRAVAAAKEVEAARERAARDSIRNYCEVRASEDRTYHVGNGVEVIIHGNEQLMVKLAPGATPLDGGEARWIFLSLPSATLRRLADARDLHERWIRGEIAELPTELP